MSEGQRPSMGRVVFVKMRDGAPGVEEVVRSATITHVHNDTCVDLRVNLSPRDRELSQSMKLDRDGTLEKATQGAGELQWFWPPRV